MDPERGWMRGYPYYYMLLAGAHHVLGDHERELEAAVRGREQYVGLRYMLFEVRALAALGLVEQLNERLDQSLNMMGGWSSNWTPGDLMLAAAAELRAHGYKAEARPILDRAVTWHEERPPEEAATANHRYGYALSLYQSERWEEADALFRELSTEYPTSVTYKGFLGVIAARRGDLEAASEIDGQLAAVDRPYMIGFHTYWRSRIAAVLEDRESAVRLLRDAAAAGWPYFRGSQYWIHSVMDFESLSHYPPYQELVRPKG